ncbi:MAG TPA: SDR family oxidoreductase [Acidimicrobiales bacterium]|jgi:3-oxoacyl-[acyl-carrier protein] reductase|nr:SDR family oxidoreductase [Acidimicrobiales bacterium]
MIGALKGRSALVTGAGRGIGRAIALGLAADGARVALLARSLDQLAEVAAAVRADGGTALVVPTDVGDPVALDEAAAMVLAEFGAVDILVNDAAVVAPLGATVSVDADVWAEALAVNVVGPFRLTQAVLPGMMTRGWGRIANVSSSIAAHPATMIGMNAYAASKSALESHTLNLAAELTDTGVTVNIYRPGSVDTAMQGWIRSQPAEEIGVVLHERFIESYERGSLLTPEQSARSLLTRLAGDATGQIWSVEDPT